MIENPRFRLVALKVLDVTQLDFLYHPHDPITRFLIALHTVKHFVQNLFS